MGGDATLNNTAISMVNGLANPADSNIILLQGGTAASPNQHLLVRLY